MEIRKDIIENLLNLIPDEYYNDKWITIKPHGDDSDDYRRLKLEDGETPKEAIDRVYKKKDNAPSNKEETKPKKDIYEDFNKQIKNLGILKKEREGLANIQDVKKKVEMELIQNITNEYRQKHPENPDNVYSPEVQKELYEKNKEAIEKARKDLEVASRDYIQQDDKIREALSNVAKSYLNINLDDLNTKDELLDHRSKLMELRHTIGLPFELRKQLEETRFAINDKYDKLEKIEKYNINTKDVNLAQNIINGVKKGQPMTRVEANTGRTNPNYQSTDKGYRYNCQSCVACFEARLRGFNVKTKPNTKSYQSRLWELSGNSAQVWLNKDNSLVDYELLENAKGYAACYKELDKKVEKNNRYTFRFSWSSGHRRGGHVVNIDRNEKGELRIYDPQSSKEHNGQIEVKEYLKHIAYRKYKPGLLRVDDKKFNPYYINEIVEGA